MSVGCRRYPATDGTKPNDNIDVDTAVESVVLPGDAPIADTHVDVVKSAMVWPNLRMLNPFAHSGVSAANYSECIKVDWESPEAEEELRKPENEGLASSLQRAKDAKHLGCISTIIDTFCQSRFNVLYDYESMRPKSSCGIDQIFKEGSSELRKQYTDTAVPESFSSARKIVHSRPYNLALLLVVYSRSVLQQIKRAINVMTHTNVIIFIHVDRSHGCAPRPLALASVWSMDLSVACVRACVRVLAAARRMLTQVESFRSDYLRRELTAYALQRTDVHMIPNSFDTIWAGSGLMEMCAVFTLPVCYQPKSQIGLVLLCISWCPAWASRVMRVSGGGWVWTYSSFRQVPLGDQVHAAV